MLKKVFINKSNPNFLIKKCVSKKLCMRSKKLANFLRICQNLETRKKLFDLRMGKILRNWRPNPNPKFLIKKRVWLLNANQWEATHLFVLHFVQGDRKLNPHLEENMLGMGSCWVSNLKMIYQTLTPLSLGFVFYDHFSKFCSSYFE